MMQAGDAHRQCTQVMHVGGTNGPSKTLRCTQPACLPACIFACMRAHVFITVHVRGYVCASRCVSWCVLEGPSGCACVHWYEVARQDYVWPCLSTCLAPIPCARVRIRMSVMCGHWIAFNHTPPCVRPPDPPRPLPPPPPLHPPTQSPHPRCPPPRLGRWASRWTGHAHAAICRQAGRRAHA